ncbi:MAG: TonB-dependent receptor [Novosphingobium sp.]
MKLRQTALASVALLSISTPAFAQDADDGENTGNGEEIVVTGTLIRGIAPGGSQSIGVSQEKITAIGAANTSDLIAAIPQAGNFNAYVGVRGSSNFSLAVNRPSLRYLGFTASSTASTLLLLDGHRMPGMGVNQTSADLDAIPAGAIERVEIVTDGGSSTYGSDAVGGVMNFITRKEFDGVEARAQYGFGEDYDQFNATVTVGKKWDGGSAYISYDYGQHDELFGFNRDWNQSLNWPLTQAAGMPVGASVNCVPGNISYANTGAIFGLPGLSSSSVNRCDVTDFTTFYPRETKHSALASLLIDPGGAWSFSIKAFYVNRKNTSDAGPLTADVTVTPASQFYIPIAGQSGNQTARINFGPVLGNNVEQVTSMESFGITPSVKVDVGGRWQVNAFFNYGRGKAGFRGGLINTAPLNAGAANGSFNPYNLAATSNAGTIASATDWFIYARAVNELVNARAVADGPLFKLPGGDVRVAVGAEYSHEKYTGFQNRTITSAGIAAATDRSVSRNVKAVFGEINVPIIGADNRGVFHSLSLTASGRYDDYSDAGHTFNPKFGINFEPVEWLRLRGNWGKAFQAPGLSDLFLASAPSLGALPTTLRPFFDPATPPPAVGNNAFILAFGGTKLPLAPQKAKTWSLGFDIKPPASGFSAGMTYYNINFKGLIAQAPIQLPSFYSNFATNVVKFTDGNSAMEAYFNSLVAETGVSSGAVANALAAIGNNFGTVYAVMDARTANQAGVTTTGLDFYLRYTRQTGFGDVYMDISGNRILSLKQGGPTGFADVNGFDVNNKLKMATTLGTHYGNLQAQVTWMYNDGVNEVPNAANLQQSRVGSFSIFNLYLNYKVPGESVMFKDLAFSLNIDNVFNTDPPLYRGLSNSLNGIANGFTLGRIVKIGVSKKF